MAAKDIDDVLNGIKDAAVQEAVSNFKDLLAGAKADSSALAKETAAKIERWMVMLRNGELSRDEFEMLMYARDRAVRQQLNTMKIATRARVEGLALGMIDVVLNKLVEAIPTA
jgi:hypothetical protein